MKPSLKIVFPILISIFITGCYSTKWIPYAGGQRDWPTSDGAFLRSDTPIPTYYGYPPVPYTFLAQIQIFTANQNSVDPVVAAAVEAKTRGADALIVTADNIFASGSVGVGSAFASPTRNGGAIGIGSSFSANTYGGQAICIAVKWKDSTYRPAWTNTPATSSQPIIPSQRKSP